MANSKERPRTHRTRRLQPRTKSYNTWKCLICLINTRTQCMMMAISLGAWLRFRRPFTNNLAILYSPECLEQSLLHLPRSLMPSICHMFQTNAEISPVRFLEPESLRYWQLMKLTTALNFIIDLWLSMTKFRKCLRGISQHYISNLFHLCLCELSKHNHLI